MLPILPHQCFKQSKLKINERLLETLFAYQRAMTNQNLRKHGQIKVMNAKGWNETVNQSMMVLKENSRMSHALSSLGIESEKRNGGKGKKRALTDGWLARINKQTSERWNVTLPSHDFVFSYTTQIMDAMKSYTQMDPDTHALSLSLC